MKMVIVGAGQMGAGIAQVAAVAGVSVLINDRNESLIERAITGITRRLMRQVEKGYLERASCDRALAALTPCPLLQGLDVDFAIEAVSEDAQLKREIFRQLEEATPSQAILASNTSSISPTFLAAATQRPHRVIGMHFMNPVPVMNLVEIVRAVQTSDATVTTVERLARMWGKVPVIVHDHPGFVANRILMPMINEAIFALGEGVAGVEGIDTIMRLGMNHPLGPLALADLIGLDTCLAILHVLHEEFGDPKYRAAQVLRRLVAAGELGRKTGVGFYRYGHDGECLEARTLRG